MPHFASYDGTELGYHVRGDGPPLVCLPGGPGRATDYLGDLGGLDRSRQLVLLDPRGVGLSADPADPATFRVDRLVQDVAALRAHLGLDRMDLLAHSAGSVLGTLYAAAFPDSLGSLILLTPGLAAIGLDAGEDERIEVLERRANEPWYATARAALDKIMSGELSMDAYRASRALFYARWDETSQAHATMGVAERHFAARDGYFADVPLDPPATIAALTKLTAPVLLYAGDQDALVPVSQVHTAAPLFPNATVVVQPGAGHFPWIDDPALFAANITAFLG